MERRIVCLTAMTLAGLAFGTILHAQGSASAKPAGAAVKRSPNEHGVQVIGLSVALPDPDNKFGQSQVPGAVP